MITDADPPTVTDGLTVERHAKPVPFNAIRKGPARWAISKELADWRAWARDEGAGWVVRTPVSVRVEHLRLNRSGMPDVGAPLLAVKAVIDGLVDAGVLPGDDPRYVHRLTFEAPQIVGWHGLRLTLTTITKGLA